jgi:type 1 glutamine amidotransferase
VTRLSRTLRATALLVAAALALFAPMVSTASAAPTAAFRVLVFSKTTGFRHDSIPAGITAIQQLGAQNNFAVDATEDDTKFTDTNLAQYAAVIFLSATGDPVSTQAEKDAFQRYIEHGGGFVGIHAASDSGTSWPWYGQLVGSYFKQHPAIQQATVRIEDPAHPSTTGLPTAWVRTDEWYDFQTNPRPNVHVLTTLDESTYSGGTMGADHPNTWCHNFDGGRAWYTGMGHTIQSFSEPNFLHLLLGGIQTAAGAVAANCAVATPPPPPAVISLRAHANGKFVTAGANPLIANSTTSGTAQQFDRLDAGGGNIALRAHANNRIVSAENAGSSALIANRTSIGSWETFQLVRNADGSVSLKALVNSRFVTAENAGNSALIANRTAIGPWEEFDLIAS